MFLVKRICEAVLAEGDHFEEPEFKKFYYVLICCQYRSEKQALCVTYKTIVGLNRFAEKKPLGLEEKDFWGG